MFEITIRKKKNQYFKTKDDIENAFLRRLEGYSFEDISILVCSVMGANKDAILTKNRKDEIVAIKHIFRYICCLAKFKLKDIATFSGVHYSTIIHSRDFIIDMIDINDKQTISTITKIIKTVNS